MNTANKDALLTLVASNPVLFLQLKEKSSAERVGFLLDTIKALPSVEGIRDGKLDDELVPYLDYLFAAISALPEAAVERRNYRLAAAAQLFLWFTDTTNSFTSKVLFPKIPKTFARLTSEMAGSWGDAESEDEAREHLRSIANLYLKTGSESECKDWRQAIRTAVNRSGRESSPQRLANSIVALSGITTWNFGESIFDSVAISRVRRLITSRPASVTRDAEIHVALGDTPSDEADEAVVEYAKLIGKLDETARSLRRHDPNVMATALSRFDVKAMTVELVMDVPTVPIESAIMEMKAAIKLHAESWLNPHCGETQVRIEWRKSGINDRCAFHALTVGGIHAPAAAAA